MKRMLSRPSRRQLLLGLGLLGLSGCWGSFNLTGRVYDWNGHFDSKWVSWLVFLAFIILPVYGTLLFIDAVILNTVEFFSGNNPVKRSADLGNGHRLVMQGNEERTHLRVEHYEHDRLVRVFHVERRGEDELRVSDGQGRARLHLTGHRGGARLRDEQGRELARLDREALEEAMAAGEDGRSVAAQVLDGLDATSRHRMLAAAERHGGWV